MISHNKKDIINTEEIKLIELIEKINTNPQNLSYEYFPLNAFTIKNLIKILNKVIPNQYVDEEFDGQRTFELSVKGGNVLKSCLGGTECFKLDITKRCLWKR